tara:strand:+ start:942 stop:1457 length:516 start_codon:yes stop_codon:yes gene_type:complete
MAVVQNPDWLASEEMVTWLSDTNFPYTTVEQMLKYIRVKWPNAFERVVILDNQMPQSYAHWWCHCRANYRKTKKAVPQYVEEPIEQISNYLMWLDMLVIDISILTDEIHHEGVPRLYGNEILFNKGDPTKRRSRRDTVKFIVSKGTNIFEERGFYKGLQWWENQCKVVNSL